MKFEEAVEKVKNSPEYKDFIKQYPNAYLAVGFFILDFSSEFSTDVHQIHFYIPNENRVGVFNLEKDLTVKIEDALGVMNQLNSVKIKVQIRDLKKIVSKEIKKKKIKKTLNKIIAVLQNDQGKEIWNLTCMLDTLGIVKMKIDALNGKVIESQFTDLLSMFKKITKNSKEIQKMQEEIEESKNSKSKDEEISEKIKGAEEYVG